VNYDANSYYGPALEQGFLEFISALPNLNHLVPESQDGTAENKPIKNKDYFFAFFMTTMLSKSNALWGRNVFQTTTGHYGYGPAGRNDIDARAVETGDSIVVFAGQCHIFIIRPVEDGMYTMVGRGYIPGLEEGWPAFKEVEMLELVPIRIR
jgi:hypothetical protein